MYVLFHLAVSVAIVFGFIQQTSAFLKPDSQKKCFKDLPGSNDFDPAGYGTGGPVDVPDTLSCDFASPCCWRGAEGDSKPLQLLNGNPKKCINIPYGTGKYAMFSGKTNKVHLESCSILCSEGPVLMKADYYSSSNVKVEACLRQSFSGGDPIACQPLRNGEAISWEKAELQDIVIRAKNFKADDDLILIKQVTVDFKPCRTAAAQGICNVKCGMGGEEAYAGPEKLCAWQNVGDRKFLSYDAQMVVGNADTGVNADYIIKKDAAQYPAVAEGPFAALGLNPGETASLRADGIVADEDLNVIMEVYEACNDAYMEVCTAGDSGSSSCVAATDRGAKMEDRQWKKVAAMVPKGTNTVVIHAKNPGDYYCAAGITNIDIVTALDQGPICDQ